MPFAGSAGGLVIAVVLVLGLAGSFRPAPVDGDQRQGVCGQLLEGFAFVRGHRELATVTPPAAVLSAADAAWFAVLVLYSLEVFGLPAVGFGVLLAIGAVGGIAGAVSAERLTACWTLRTLLTATLALSAITQLGLGVARDVGVAAVLIAVSSLSFGVWNVVAMSLGQRVSPAHLLGRVNATYRAAAMVIPRRRRRAVLALDPTSARCRRSSRS